MALVAYGSSDSEFEEDETNGEDVSGDPTENQTMKKQDTENSKLESNIFTVLPQPSRKECIKEDDDEILHKKAVPKSKAQISIPSLSTFKDIDDGPIQSRPKFSNGKKSGLLSMLPEPKFTRTLSTPTTKAFIPRVLERKTIKVTAPHGSKTSKESVSGKPNSNKKQLIASEYSDDSDNEDACTSEDFFSFKTSQNSVLLDEVAVASSSVKVNTPFVQSSSLMDIDDSDIVTQSSVEHTVVDDYTIQMDNQDEGPAPSSSMASNIELDDEAIRRLCGTRKRHRKEDIQIINVDQQQVLSDAREWLVKGLMDDTTKRVSCSKRKGDEPTNQQKRKHQITYLAHQAKANEVDLQNQWSNNRMSRRQTQSKYGF